MWTCSSPNCSAASALFYQSNHRSDVSSKRHDFFNWNPTNWSEASRAKLVVFDRTFQYWSVSLVKFDTSFFDQFTSVNRLLCSFFRTNLTSCPTKWKGYALFHSRLTVASKNQFTIWWITPFIFRGFPRLSILFYTIFHKKASQNQSKKEKRLLVSFSF